MEFSGSSYWLSVPYGTVWGRSGTYETGKVHLSENISTGPRSQLWVPALLVLGFVLLNASGWWYYQNSHESLSGTVGRRLLESTRFVADGLDADRFAYAANMFDPEADIYLDSMLSEAESFGQFAALHLLSPVGDLDESIRRLKSLPGIGEWTAQYIAMRVLREPDAFPASDVGLLRAMTKRGANGEKRPTPDELLERAATWRPWRAYAAQHLWVSDADAR